MAKVRVVDPTSFNETSAAAERREEVMAEGKRRWEAYRKRQGTASDLFDALALVSSVIFPVQCCSSPSSES